MLCGTDDEVLGVLEERQSGGPDSIIGAKVIVGPSQILRNGVIEIAAVSHYITVNSIDSGLEQQLLPAAEKALERLGARYVCTQARVCPTYDVKISVKNPVACGSAIGKSRLETEIRSQLEQGNAGGEQLHIRCGDQFLPRVHAGEGIALRAQGKNRHHAPGQRLAGTDAVDRSSHSRGSLIASRGLRSRNRALPEKQERDTYRKKRSCGHLFD